MSDYAELRQIAWLAVNETPDYHLLPAKYELGERGKEVLALLDEIAELWEMLEVRHCPECCCEDTTS